MEATIAMFERFRKAVSQMIFPSEGGSSLLTLPRTGYDYSSQVEGYQSAIIMSCVNWIQRTFPEAPLYLRKRNADGSFDDIYEHPMLELLDTPNPYYDGLLLQAATIADYTIDGNAYWQKIRSAAGRVVQLWWIPSPLIKPKWGWNNEEYISYYEYQPGGILEKVPPEDIVHFRYGLDPENIRKGLSPLKSLVREMFTDDEAANMTASLLKNLGVPGVVISPKEGGAGMGGEQGKDIKEWFKDSFTGDKRGEPLVMSGATNVEQFGFSPKDMDLKDLRRLPEERISGVLGVPAIVAGLGAGLARSTFANFAEAREMAYESNIIPSQRVFGSVQKRQLLSEFEDDISPWQVAYDLSEVRVLQEDENKKAERVGKMVLGGYVTVANAQRETGMPVDESQKLYLRPLTLVEVPASSPAKALIQSIETKLTPAEWEDEYSEGTPHWAVDKNPSMFAQEFAEKLQELKMKTLLEIGCGNGRDSIFFAHAGIEVTAVDVSPSAIELARQNAQDAEVSVDFQVANAEELSFADGQFNGVFSLSVLHATDLKKSIPEVNRVLSNKGIAFIYLYGDTQYADGKREEYIAMDDWLELLKSLNFTVLDFYSEQEEEFDEFGEKHQLLISLIQKG